MEKIKCSRCNRFYERELLSKVKGSASIYVDPEGHRMFGTRCYGCHLWKVKSHRVKKKEEEKHLDMPLGSRRSCPQCGCLTVNRFACNDCWRDRPSLQEQDMPRFTKEERQAMDKITLEESQWK